MKKLVGTWLALLMLCTIGLQVAAGEEGDDSVVSSVEILQDEQEDVQPAETAVGGNASARWTYGVSMHALQSEYIRLVNRDHLLDADYEPGDLEKMNVKRATSSAVYMRRVAANALDEMFAAAKEDGYTLYLKSGYRAYGAQKTMYSNRLEGNKGNDDGVVAPPGASEHQMGLSCDIVNAQYSSGRMNAGFAETAEGKWLKENCASHGFVMSYPEGKEEITGFIFEPWHFRYVGTEVANYVQRTDLTHVEFNEEWQREVADFESRGGNIAQQISYEQMRSNTGPEAFILDVVGADGDSEISIAF